MARKAAPPGMPSQRQLRAGELTAAVSVEHDLLGQLAAHRHRIATAASTRSVRMCSSMAQPITRRLQPSRTAHRYSQPSPVRK